jgi:hypothetical protein
LRLTVASGIPSLRDAPERLPASTAASNVDMDSSRSMAYSIIWNDGSIYNSLLTIIGRAYIVVAALEEA